jgi:hypothetical protein
LGRDFSSCFAGGTQLEQRAVAEQNGFLDSPDTTGLDLEPGYQADRRTFNENSFRASRNAPSGFCRWLVHQETHVTVIWLIPQQVPTSPRDSNKGSLPLWSKGPFLQCLLQWILGSMALDMIKVS